MNSSFLSPIIKSNEVNIDGTFKLPISESFAAGGANRACAHNSGVADGGQPSARVIETTAEYATIEVVCPCGTVSHVRCSYN